MAKSEVSSLEAKVAEGINRYEHKVARQRAALAEKTAEIVLLQGKLKPDIAKKDPNTSSTQLPSRPRHSNETPTPMMVETTGNTRPSRANDTTPVRWRSTNRCQDESR